MDSRKYSVAEIDRMRKTIRGRFPSYSYGVGYPEPEGEPSRLNARFDATAEDMLRTYMLNGTDPDELANGSDGQA